MSLFVFSSPYPNPRPWLVLTYYITDLGPGSAVNRIPERCWLTQTVLGHPGDGPPPVVVPAMWHL